MVTKFINIKEFRQNIAAYAKQAQSSREKQRLVVINRTTPLFELRPFPKGTDLSSLLSDVLAAKEDVKKGRVYSHEAVLEALR